MSASLKNSIEFDEDVLADVRLGSFRSEDHKSQLDSTVLYDQVNKKFKNFRNGKLKGDVTLNTSGPVDLPDHIIDLGRIRYDDNLAAFSAGK